MSRDVHVAGAKQRKPYHEDPFTKALSPLVYRPIDLVGTRYSRALADGPHRKRTMGRRGVVYPTSFRFHNVVNAWGSEYMPSEFQVR